MNRTPTQQAIISLIIIGALALLICVGGADGEQSPGPHSTIESKFILTQGKTVALDKHLIINLYSWESKALDYSIMINNEVMLNGSFVHYSKLYLNISRDFISSFKVYINDTLALEMNNIVLLSYGKYNIPSEDTGDFNLIKITMSWLKGIQWAEFWAIITALFISIPIAWRVMVYYTENKGVERIC